MILVIDASVAAKWFLKEDLQDNARTLVSNRFDRIAPDWVIQEVAHVIFKKWRNNAISADQAKAIIQVMPEYFSTLVPSADVAVRAFDISLEINHPVYDCLYLACAAMFPTVVVTNDRHLHRAVQDTEYQKLVWRLDDPDLLAPMDP